MKTKVLKINNLEDTKNLAIKLTPFLKQNSIILLNGDLGAGKTTFVSFVMEKLGYKDIVSSPSFNILKCYFEVKPNVFHIDAYRLEGMKQDLGLEEYIDGEGICFIEWSEYILDIIPNKYLSISIKDIIGDKRTIIVEDKFDLYNEFMESIND